MRPIQLELGMLLEASQLSTSASLGLLIGRLLIASLFLYVGLSELHRCALTAPLLISHLTVHNSHYDLPGYYSRRSPPTSPETATT